MTLERMKGEEVRLGKQTDTQSERQTGKQTNQLDQSNGKTCHGWKKQAKRRLYNKLITTTVKGSLLGKR